MSEPTVLVIEDDDDIRGLVLALVQRARLRGIGAADGREGIRRFFESRPDLVVLDLGLPELDGWQVLERVRDVSMTPVLLLTAESDESQKVRGLRSGGDDFVTKPFGHEELLARIEGLLRRAGPSTSEFELLSDGSLLIDEAQRRVEVAGNPVNLTPTEFRLLATLMRNRNQVITQEQLLEQVWDNTDGNPRQVRLYVSYVRRKLDAAGEVDAIETVRGFGYRFRPAGTRPGTGSQATT